MESSKEIIESVRKKFLDEVKDNPSVYHEKDVERIKSDDWSVERFLLVNEDENQALKALINAMQWRKSIGVNDFNDASFPKEMYEIGKIHIYGKDKDGRLMFWYVAKNHFKASEFVTLEKQFVAYMIDKIDTQCGRNQWAFIGDVHATGLSNVDMDYFNFIVELLQTYFPRGMKYLLTSYLPLILYAVAKLALAFMNQDLKDAVNLNISSGEMIEYIDANVLPVHLGGTFAGQLSQIPSDVKPMAQLNFDGKRVKKFYSTYKSCLPKALS